MNERAKVEEWDAEEVKVIRWIKDRGNWPAPESNFSMISWELAARMAARYFVDHVDAERQASRVAALEERWVSVDERLPEGNDNYLVATPDRGVEEARYVADDQDWYAVATDAYNENIELHNVTHWALLPDPPAAAIRSLAEAPTKEK